MLRGKSLTPCLGSDVHQPLHRAIHECLLRLQCLLTQRAVATDTWPQLQSLSHQDTISHFGFALKYPLPCNAMDKLQQPSWAAISDHHCSFWVRNTLLVNMSSGASQNINTYIVLGFFELLIDFGHSRPLISTVYNR